MQAMVGMFLGAARSRLQDLLMLSRSNAWGRCGNSSIIKEQNSGILFLSDPCTKILNCPSDIIIAIAVCIFGRFLCGSGPSSVKYCCV